MKVKQVKKEELMPLVHLVNKLNFYIYVADRMQIVFLGNIGVGKTVLLKELVNFFESSTVLQEPVNEWNENGLLTNYGTKPEDFGFPLQVVVMSSLMRAWKSYDNQLASGELKFLFQERDFKCSRYIFQKILEKNNHLNIYQIQALNQLFMTFDSFYNSPDLYIYLTCSVEICQKRCFDRGHTWDRDTTLDHLIAIDKNYNEYVKNLISEGETVIKINAEHQCEEVVDNVKRCIKTWMKENM